MKRNLFLLSTAALALTPAIVAQADDFSTNEWVTIYESPLLAANEETRTIAATNAQQYTVNSPESVQQAFLQGLEAYSDTITLHYTGPLDAQQLFKEVSATWHNIHNLNDYLSGNVSTLKLNSSQLGNNTTLTISVGYHANHVQQQYIDTQVQQIIAQIIKPGMTDFEKVKAVTDYIVLNHSYSAYTNGSPHSVYTFLTEKQGVCQAYALLAQRIFDEIGIPSHYVTGYAGEAHAWNLVQVDGEWYHLDVTWADPVFNQYDASNENYISYSYFLMSDAQIAEDHTVDPKETSLPKATSTRYTAYHAVNTPVQIGNELFFSNDKDEQKLYKLNVTDHTPALTKVSDKRFQHLFYANGVIYFSNYSNSGYLSTFDPTTSEITLLKNETITHIVREGQNLVAYNGAKVVYTEAITAVQAPEPEMNPLILAIIQQIDALDPAAASFFDDYVAVADSINALTEQEIEQITNAQKFIDLHAIADKYLTEIEQITQAIEALNTDIALATLKDLAIEARQLVDNASEIIQKYIDVTNLVAIEQFISKKEAEQQQNSNEQFIQQAEQLVKDLKFLSKDFITRAEQMATMLELLGDNASKLFSQELLAQAEKMQQLYEKMQNLSFDNSSAFSPSKTTKDASKPWTVTLSQELPNTATNLSKIKVVDMFGDPIDVTIAINGKKIVVTPNKNYEPDIPYTLVIEAGLESVKGTTLKKGHHLEFTFTE